MSRTLQNQLWHDLETLRRFARQPDWFGLSEDDRQELLDQAESFQQRLQAVEDEILGAGFLGGTGVGKSSLMNALARADVASTSHRRPHTERIVLYHHQDRDLPLSMTQTRAAWTQVTHRVEGMRGFVLCDLPDFDSLRAENREAVLEFMANLDLLVWVTSPEKYADRSLHSVVSQAPKAAGNFYFVLNKVDRLYSGSQSEDGLEAMQRVAEHFRSTLVRTLTQRRDRQEPVEPRLYLVSAVESPPYSAWNQLNLFRDHLLTQRSMKQVSAIKAANLDQDLRALCRPLRAEHARMEEGVHTLHLVQQEVQQARETWRKAGETLLAAWVQRRVEPLLVHQVSSLGSLKGPARLLGWAIQQWQRSRSAEHRVQVPDIQQEEDIQALKSRLDQMRNRLLPIASRRQLPDSLRQELERIVDVSGRWERLTSSWQTGVSMLVSERRPRRRPGFVVAQSLVYLLCTVFFILGLGGQEAWMEVLRNPGLGTGLQVVFAVLERLFSPIGLAALGSYGLLMLLLGARFYRTHRHKLEQWASEQGSLLTAGLVEHWEQELRDLEQGVQQMQAGLQEQLQTLESIMQPRGF